MGYLLPSVITKERCILSQSLSSWAKTKECITPVLARLLLGSFAVLLLLLELVQVEWDRVITTSKLHSKHTEHNSRVGLKMQKV
jgi:hypothetical protein